MLETFLGVLASFASWFGAQKWLRNQKEKKAKANMSKELKEEILINIGMLDVLIKSVPRELKKGNVPALIPSKLKLQVYDYIIQSGDIRLFGDFSKQRKIRMIGYLCEHFNHFIDNTENILAILLLKPNSLGTAHHRLANFVESAKDTRKAIYDLFTKLELNNDYEEENSGIKKERELRDIFFNKYLISQVPIYFFGGFLFIRLIYISQSNTHTRLPIVNLQIPYLPTQAYLVFAMLLVALAMIISIATIFKKAHKLRDSIEKRFTLPYWVILIIGFGYSLASNLVYILEKGMGNPYFYAFFGIGLVLLIFILIQFIQSTKQLRKIQSR